MSAAIERVLALTRELKIDPKYVDSTRLQVQPDYRWNDKDSQRVLLGYVVSRQIEVELRDLDQLGALLERAVSAAPTRWAERSWTRSVARTLSVMHWRAPSPTRG